MPITTLTAQTILPINISLLVDDSLCPPLTLDLHNSGAISVITIQGSAEVLKLVSDIPITLIHPFNNPIK